MMIPGAREPRTHPAVAAPLPPPVRGVEAETTDAWPPGAPRRELPGWLRIAIFALVLLIAMWLAIFTIIILFWPVFTWAWGKWRGVPVKPVAPAAQEPQA